MYNSSFLSDSSINFSVLVKILTNRKLKIKTFYKLYIFVLYQNYLGYGCILFELWKKFICNKKGRKGKLLFSVRVVGFVSYHLKIICKALSR